ncbi:MAG: glucose-1-phosphate cytidylyltransferase [Bacteroidales bacterium]|nr:glucose-1-phosphate cytidylyltransferase [Bacteroidales bacterium]
MKTVILAGGFGTRFSEETKRIPKPMTEIGGKPILWHIMKIYSTYGFNDFVLCLGYKSFVIKEWFLNYFAYNNDIEVDVKNNTVRSLNNETEPWKITLAETGLNTMTGGRIKRIQKYIGDEPFMLTYGDGVADIDIPALLDFHKKQGKLLTVTSYRHLERWGLLDINEDGLVKGFLEKPENTKTFINGGFFVCQPEVFDYLDGDDCVFERKPIERLAKEGQLVAYNHTGFWRCMDTLKDNNDLNELWNGGDAPWKIW